jgi:FkbM family methyltransferase
MSDGSTIRCRLQDAGDLISVYVDNDYRRFEVDWAGLRQVIDVGSTVGAFTIWVAKRARHARFLAVEPNPDLVPYLIGNIELNSLGNRVTVIDAALGAAPGMAQLEDNQALSTLMRVVPLGHGTGHTVRVLTLGQVLQQIGTPSCDLLKIDCEGGEYDILLSASDAALQAVGTVICEYHPSPVHRREELVERLTHAGFNVASDSVPLGFIYATRI